jgi:hypothetical protein
VVAGVIILRGSEGLKRPIRYRFAVRLAFIAIWWAAIEVLLPAKLIIKGNDFTDRAAAVCQRLRQLSGADGITNSSEIDPRRLVFASDNKVAVIMPTFAPQAILWAPHFDFLNLAPGESRIRFYQYLYYSGIDRNQFMKELGQPMSTLAAAAFGHERVIPDLSTQPRPITSEEIAAEGAAYQAYYSSFTRERAVEHILSYVVVPIAKTPNLTNLDRWYQRDKGEQVDEYMLYKVQLRP